MMKLLKKLYNLLFPKHYHTYKPIYVDEHAIKTMNKNDAKRTYVHDEDAQDGGMTP